MEAEERRKKGRRQEALAGLQVQLGSLRVHSLGTLVPAAWGSHSQHVSRASCRVFIHELSASDFLGNI